MPEKGFVFCNFNSAYKLTPESFDSWMRILKAVEGSVLWLLESAAPHAGNLRKEAEKRGVPGERLIFAPDLLPDQHLARLQLADLFLDGLPYNAHTTGSDALWAGVPLITRRGTTFPGRVAASLLTAAGLPELVTESAADFEALAIKLAGDPKALKAPARQAREMPKTAALVRHRSVPPQYRSRLSHHVGALACGRRSRKALWLQLKGSVLLLFCRVSPAKRERLRQQCEERDLGIFNRTALRHYPLQ